MDEENIMAQAEEIEILKSIYTIELVEEFGRFTFKLSPTTKLFITLHPDYPSRKPPQYELMAHELTGEEIKNLSMEFETIYAENMGEPILYQWIEKLKEYTIYRPKNKRIRRNSGSFSKKEKAKPVLHRSSSEIVPDSHLKDRKRVFQGHACAVYCEEDVSRSKNIRIRRNSESISKKEKPKPVLQRSSSEIVPGSLLKVRKSVIQGHACAVYCEEDVRSKNIRNRRHSGSFSKTEKPKPVLKRSLTEIVPGSLLKDRKSVFQGHACAVHCEEDVRSRNIRIRRNSESFSKTEKPKPVLQRSSTEIVPASLLKDRKSVFQGHACAVHCEEDVRSRNIRIRRNSGSFSKKEKPKLEPKPKPVLQRVASEIVHGPVVKDRKNVFQGHACAVYSEEDVRNSLDILKQNKKIDQATHNIYAFSINNNSLFLEDCKDDGEKQASKGLLHLLQKLHLSNVMVVVSRWRGSTLLGSDRFRHITNCARQALREGGFIK